MAGDWISNFVTATEGIGSPEVFRLWAAIVCVGAAAEKKVFTTTARGRAYPNMYVVLTGTPGTGKSQAITRARLALAEIVKRDQFHLGPDNVTNASFFDRLAASTRSYLNGSASLSIFHSMAVLSREFGVFIPRYDLEFLSNVSDIFDNPPSFDMPRRTSVSVNIANPSFTLLSGVQPDFLGELLPEAAWGQGFTSRIIFVYGTREDDRDVDYFTATGDDTRLQPLFDPLHQIYQLAGEFIWTEAARQEFNRWRRDGMNPLPTHGRLVHYRTRREHHLTKICMISALSAGRFPEVHLADFERGYGWLTSAEALMPDIFRAMALKSDRQIIEDLHHTFWARQMNLIPRDRKPVHVDLMVRYLHARVPHEKIKGIIATAIDAGYFKASTFPNEFMPRPLNEINDAVF